MARTYAEVIEEHRVELGADKVHVDYVPGVDPERLAQELARVRGVIAEYEAVDPAIEMEARLEHYENVFSEIRKLCQTNVRDFVANTERNPELETFKRLIGNKADSFSLDLSMDYVIEYAKKKNAT